MQKELKNILVPVNFSDASSNAVQTAIAICKRHEAKLHLVNVFETDILLPTAGMQVPATGMVLELHRSRNENLEQMAAAITRHNGIVCSWHCEAGYIPHIISLKAKELDCDMIVVGTSHSSKLRKALGGNIAMSVLKRATVPVLTVPAGRPVPHFKNILFPVRPVLNAIDKIRNAACIIKKNSANVMVLGLVERHQGHKLGRVRNLVDMASAQMQQTAEGVHNRVKYGYNAGDEVLETGREKNMDLVIVTAILRRSMMRYFFPGYIQKLINNTFLPVLFVKPALGAGEHELQTLLRDEARF